MKAYTKDLKSLTFTFIYQSEYDGQEPMPANLEITTQMSDYIPTIISRVVRALIEALPAAEALNPHYTLPSAAVVSFPLEQFDDLDNHYVFSPKLVFNLISADSRPDE